MKQSILMVLSTIFVFLILSTSCGSPGGGSDDAASDDAAIVIPTELSAVRCLGPLNAAAGSLILLANTVENDGSASCTFDIAFYLSTDNSITTGDTLLDTETVVNLAPGAESSADTPLTIPGGTAPGTYYLGIIADAADAVTEINELDNALACVSPVVVTGASSVDLVVTNVADNGGGVYDPSDPIDIDNTIENTGAAGAGSFIVAFYASLDTEITETDIFLGQRIIASLASGAANSDTTPCTIPAAAADGTYYYIGAIVDQTDSVSESDEANNAAASIGTIGVGTSGLTADGLEPDDVIGDASSIAVDGGYLNHSKHTLADVDWMKFDIPAPQGVLIELDDHWGEVYGTDGETVLATIDDVGLAYIMLPEAGTYYIRIAEGSLINYAIGVRTFVLGADIDLVVDSVTTISEYALPGEDTITGVIGVENIGGDNAPVFNVDVYLSDDMVITAADIYLTTIAYSGLQSGDLITKNFTSPEIPDTVAQGVYYLGIIIDPDDDVIETNEGNNTDADTSEIYVDWDLAAVSVQPVNDPVAVGVNEAVNYTVSSNPAGPDVVSGILFLSDDTVYDAADTQLLSVSDTTAMPSPVNVQLPAGLVSGTYYLGISLNDGRAYKESDYSNNVVFSTSFTVNNPNNYPDLIIQSVSYFGATLCDPGDEVIPIYTRENISASGGEAPGGYAGQTKTRLTLAEYSDGSGSSYTTGTTLGDVALNAGASSLLSMNMGSIPAGTPGGRYCFVAIADSDDVLIEDSETNNSLQFTQISVSGADRGEPGNNNPATTTDQILLKIEGECRLMSIHEAGDFDWIEADISSVPLAITIETYNLDDGMDTVLELWAANETTALPETKLAIDADSGAETDASKITYTFTEAGKYYLKVYHKDPTAVTGFYWIKSYIP